MSTEIEECIQICIRMINEEGKKGETSFVKKTLIKLSKEPYIGTGLGIGDYRTSWDKMMERYSDERISGISHILDWKNVMLLLFDTANLNTEEMFFYCDQLKDDIIYNHVLKHIIWNLVSTDEIAQATAYTQKFRTTHIFQEEDNLEKGYRIILQYYANKGDIDMFFKTLKLSQSRKDRYEIEVIKSLLVSTVALNQNIEAAIKLCKHKKIGDKYYYQLLRPFAEKGEYNKLKEIFTQYPELKQPEKETELSILALAFNYANEKQKECDDDFELLFERAGHVNPRLKWGEARLKDSIFLDLGMASINNQDRKIRCRKAIKNNWLKKELQ